MGFWIKILGVDKRLKKIEDMLANVHEHQHKIDMKMDILAHQVVGHLPTVADEKKIYDTIARLEKLEEHVQLLASTIGTKAE